ncbi:Arc family DNA-binding protein [Stenotrophomonas sp. C1657]|uniref:Arc family DNA-binding protein n=1 Tax=Stenotrophomonas sp. C1657 TaxID=3077844 RepID=UPI00293C64E5|nr:Arc family DNA-binding protein [Stenotrophomonas sp. C1657]MDV3515168.1 Arc family DNA-binding protein [Stenotrophomonas sp. C1657]
MSKSDDPQFKLRLPRDVRDWIGCQAAQNRSSKSSEIIRSIRERMDRVEFKATGSIGEAA